MNSTSWGSLTAYLQYLGESGLAVVEGEKKMCKLQNFAV
jgi:hypothetical protein